MSRKISVEIVGDDAALTKTFRHASGQARAFDRDLGRATRGALAGSGAFRSLGRSIAFASGGFLAFATAGDFLRKSIDAAKEAQVTQKQLAAQFRASGLNLSQYQGAIEKTTNRLSLLAGFENDELKAGFTTIFRTTGDVSKSLRDLGTAADLARAKHLGLNQAALIIAKTEAGNTTLLRRQGIQIDKNATSEQALARLRQVVAGQARAGTTAQERFGAVLHNTEEIIGNALLPILNRYLTKAAQWLTQMNESGRLQRDVNTVMKDAAAAVGALKAVVTPLADAFKSLGDAVGGTKNEIKLLGAAFLVLKTRSALINWGLIQGGIAGVGSSAKTARLEVGLLGRSLGLLKGIGAVGITFAAINSSQAGPTNKYDTWSWNGLKHGFGLFKGSTWENLAKDALGIPRAPVSTGGSSMSHAFDVQRPDPFGLSRAFSQSAVSSLMGRLGTSHASGGVARSSSLPQLLSGSFSMPGMVSHIPRASGSFQFLADSFSTPLSLQLAEARAQAQGDNINAILIKIRAAARRALRSGRLAVQGQIDAWNMIASINDQLAQTVAGGKAVSNYHAVSSRALTAGMHLSRAQRTALESRIAQAEAHRGHAPNGVAAFGQIVVNVHGAGDPDAVARKVLDKLQKHARRGSAQRRGATPGIYLGLH